MESLGLNLLYFEKTAYYAFEIHPIMLNIMFENWLFY